MRVPLVTIVEIALLMPTAGQGRDLLELDPSRALEPSRRAAVLTRSPEISSGLAAASASSRSQAKRRRLARATGAHPAGKRRTRRIR